MKKLLALFTIFLLFLSGCKQSGNLSSDLTENSPSSWEAFRSEAEDSGQSEVPTESIPLPEYDSSSTYYKLEVAPASYDTDAILRYLIPEFDEDMVQQTDNVEGTDYSIEADGVTHTWVFGKEVFYYYNDLALGEGLTEEEALIKGQDFIEHCGFAVAEHPTVRREEDGSYAIEYLAQYEGVPVLGDAIDLGNGDEDGMAQGPYIKVEVNENGITNVYLSNLVTMQGTLEEYQGEEDFVDPDRLARFISTAFQIQEEQLEENSDMDYRYDVTEIKLVYYPYEEQGKRILLPGFQVNGILWENGNALWDGSLMLLDAVSGRKVS